MKTEIIYEDKDILVIYKPAGLATQTAKVGQADVVSELKNYLKQANAGAQKSPYVGVIHRLDQPVEGLLVFAKHQKAAADLTMQLQRKQTGASLHKHYYAVFCGKPSETEGELVDYMYKSKENLAVIVENEADAQKNPQAKKAVLRYRVSETKQVSCNTEKGDNKEEVSLADIHILTGRFHQIRAQMAHGNMPLIGDTKYGSERAKSLAKQLGVSHVALCAYCLEFMHPVTKKEMSFKIKPGGKAFSFFVN